ncbi:cupin domain-containing protein [Streptomyces sp. JJ38]|uniref:cupin domain-containing protein n=1 Tax=Streptomyces sp. JJ38 TaxID=2738128 RepID=UPI001C566953|nr:cupin domain-containing protein [Streptomyces sp. JJ38]MBW1598666.1 cupin domain-containing protein [Streptomyces sp. JJ38]
MAGIVHKTFAAADERRPFEESKGELDLLQTPQGPVGQAIFEPGWRWSQHVKPIAGTDSCQAAHVGYCLSGRMKIVMDDGETAEVGPGEFVSIEPGHDAWVLGDEACVMLDWAGFGDYAKPSGS